MAASRCIRLASGLSGFSGLSGVSRLSHQKVCRAAALPRLESRPLLQRLGPSLLNASSAALYSTAGKDGVEGGAGKPTTSFTSAPSSGSGLADQILSAKVKAETGGEDGSKTGGDGKQSDGAKAEEEREEERRKEASWRAMKLSFGLFGVMCAGFGGWTIAVFGAPPKDPDGNTMPDEFSDMSIVTQYLARTWKEIKLYNKMIKDPSRDLLLPDPLQYPYMQPPYTLVLEMTGVLVHPDWTYKTGWRFKKRPGIDFFLQQVGPPLFEVVIYTAEQGFTASPIIDALDPQGYIMYRLFKDSTRYLESHHVKDLNCLNRDLSKVIMVDFNDKSVQLNPRNILKVKKWTGNDDDRSLVDLALLLKAVASSGVADVREVMDHYRQFDDPLEAFRENQRRLQEQEEAMQRQRAEDESKGALLKKRSWTSSLLRR